MAAAPITSTTENTNTNDVPPAAVQSPPVTHSQPVEIHHGQHTHIEIEDGTEQELEEEDYLTSASVTESTTTSDAIPSHMRKRTLDEVDGDDGLEYADDAYASEDVDAVSSNGVEDHGDVVCPENAAPHCGIHTNITPPIANVQLSVTAVTPTTVVNLTPVKKQRTSGSYSPTVSPARVRKRSSEELEADDLECESSCEQREAPTVTTKRVKKSPDHVSGEKPPAVILRVPPHLS